jgi:hypothetical protein
MASLCHTSHLDRDIVARHCTERCFFTARSIVKNYFDHTAIVVVMVVAVLCTSHLLSPLGTTVKQLDPACSQLVQKPFPLSFQMPTFVFRGGARACRVILPLGVKVIVNFVPVGEAALKDFPSKNVALMSFGAIGSAAKATLAWTSVAAISNEPARIGILPGTC